MGSKASAETGSGIGSTSVPGSPSENQRGHVVRSALVGVLALVALAASGLWLHQHLALQDWLAWTVIVIWGWQLVLAATLLLAGHVVVVRLLGIRPRSLAEWLALAIPAGALAFAMGMFAAGFLGFLRPLFAVLWPPGLALLALSIERNHLRDLRGWLRRYRPHSAALDPFRSIATGLGLLAVALVYLGNFSPSAITYDASWTHLTIAQDYARAGRIAPFLADWPKNLPQLGSVINTWSFLVPGLDQPAAKWMMALHTEFAFFLWTLVGAAAAMQRLGGYRPGAWAAMFLFPAFFLSDHCLGGGADHFLAFWSAPVLLALYETVATRALRWWLMLAIVLSGAVLTKLQAVIMVAPATVILTVVLLRDTVRCLRARRSWWGIWRDPLVAVGTTLVLTAPHFGANLVNHHNPLFPFAQNIFTGSTPTVPDAISLADNLLRSWESRPPSTFVEQVRSLAIAAATFPCHPNEPESGALFAVALLLTPLLPRARRVWFALLFALGTLAAWNLTYPQGRNLEGVLPIFAVVTGAVLVRAFRLGRLARFGVGMLVCFQVIAGLDAFFGSPSRIADAVSLVRSSREGRATKRFDPFFRQYIELGRSLPDNAVLLLHTIHPNLGIDRPILHDWLGFQSLIDPRTFRTSRDLYLRLKDLGITHVVYEPGACPAGTRQGEVVFDVFAARNKDSTRSFGDLRVFPMPAEAPPPETEYQALLVDISEQPDGLYPAGDLRALEELPSQFRVREPPKEPLTDSNALSSIARARVVLRGRDARLAPAIEQQLSDRFNLFVSYSDFSVFVRRP